MTKKYPLFFLDDQFLSADSDIFKLLYDKSKNYVAINGDPFCNSMWETAYLRDEWLSLCSSLSSKFEKPLLVNAAVSASSFRGLDNTAAFAEIYCIATVSDGQTMLRRFDDLNITNEERRKSATLHNSWLQSASDPDVSLLLDISTMTPEDAASYIDSWIIEHIAAE